jgi:multidrug efflux pump subunit AcrA (membrane-fusion protein)
MEGLPMIINKNPKPKRRNIKLFKLLKLFIIKVCIVLLLVPGFPGAGFAGENNRVQSGDFERTAVLTGSLKAIKAEHFIVPSTNTWRIQLKWMVEEGTTVKPGDAVARFDTSNLATDIENQEMSLEVKKEEKLQKLADYNHQKFEVEVNLKKAEIDYKKKEIDASIPKGLESNQEYDAKQLELKKSKQTLENALMEKKVKLSTLRSELKRMDLEIEEARRNLEKNYTSLNSLTLKAKTAGTVVYGRHRWERRKIQVGDNVAATWTVATIPVPGSLQVEAWVNETHIHYLIPGQNVEVHLDAYPDRVFSGAVKDVLKSAENRRRWGKAHYFSVSVQLDSRDVAIMKPGMSVKCIVKVARLEDVLLVPLAMVHYDGKSFIVKPAGEEPVRVTALGFNRFYLALSKKEAAEKGIKGGLRLEPAANGPLTGKEGTSEK